MLGALGFKGYLHYLFGLTFFTWPLLSRSLAQVELVLLLQSTLLLSLGLGAAAILGRSRPVMRSLIYRTTLSGGVVVAVCSIALAGRVHPLWTLDLPSAKPAQNIFVMQMVEAHHDLTPAEQLQVTPATAPLAPPPSTAGSTPAQASTPPSLAPAPAPGPNRFLTIDFLIGCFYLFAISIWLTGIVLQLGWLLCCQVYMLLLRRRSVAISEGAVFSLLRQLCATRHLHPPLLLASSQTQAPLLTGLWRPAILLPATYATEFDSNALKAIFLHELAHLERKDCAWNLLARLTRILLWTQPLLWMLCRRMEQASEEACDEAVINGGCPPHDYAQCLLDLTERLALKRVERTVGAGVIPLRSALAQRVRHILECSALGFKPITSRIRLATVMGTLVAVAATAMLVASATTPHAKPGRGVITGRVLYADGSPAGNIKIAAGMQDAAEMTLRYGKTAHEHTIVGETHDGATTQPDGTYSISGLAHGPYNVSAEMYSPYLTSYREPPEWVGAAAEGVPVAAKPVQAHDIILTPGAILQGRVVDKKTQQPVAGVYVSSQGPQHPKTTGEIDSCVTDKSGYFKLRVAPGKNYLYLGGQGGTRYMYVHWGDSVIYKKDLNIMKSGSTLYVLSDWTEVDVPQQPPHYLRFGGNSMQEIDIQPGQTQDIRFQLKPMTITMRQGEPVVEIPHTVPAELKQPATVPATQSDQSYHLPPEVKGTAAITGRVLFEDGRPAAGIKVIAVCSLGAGTELWGFKRTQANHWRWPPQMENLLYGTATTRADGTYRIPGLMTEKYTVSIERTPSGSEIPLGWVNVGSHSHVSAQEGQTVHASDLTIMRGAVVRVKVVDSASGKPLPQINIFGYNLRDATATGPLTGTTYDGHGHYVPSKGWTKHVDTDKFGVCAINFEPGKASLRIMGGGPIMITAKGIKRKDPIWNSTSTDSPNAIVIGKDLYAMDVAVGVSVDNAPLKWTENGETTLDLIKGQVRQVTLRMKRYGPTPPKYLAILKSHKQFLPRKQ